MQVCMQLSEFEQNDPDLVWIKTTKSLIKQSYYYSYFLHLAQICQMEGEFFAATSSTAPLHDRRYIYIMSRKRLTVLLGHLSVIP